MRSRVPGWLMATRKRWLSARSKNRKGSYISTLGMAIRMLFTGANWEVPMKPTSRPVKFALSTLLAGALMLVAPNVTFAQNRGGGGGNRSAGSRGSSGGNRGSLCSIADRLRIADPLRVAKVSRDSAGAEDNRSPASADPGQSSRSARILRRPSFLTAARLFGQRTWLQRSRRTLARRRS